MGVYIKGKMPKSCEECLFNTAGVCIINRALEPDDELTHSCPLVEVPTPHGRLIDADAFKEYIHVSFGQVAPELEGGYKWLAERITKDLLNDIDGAPTIIPEEVDT